MEEAFLQQHTYVVTINYYTERLSCISWQNGSACTTFPMPFVQWMLVQEIFFDWFSGFVFGVLPALFIWTVGSERDFLRILAISSLWHTSVQTIQGEVSQLTKLFCDFLVLDSQYDLIPDEVITQTVARIACLHKRLQFSNEIVYRFHGRLVPLIYRTNSHKNCMSLQGSLIQQWHCPQIPREACPYPNNTVSFIEFVYFTNAIPFFLLYS